jgi:hypothetical protein
VLKLEPGREEEARYWLANLAVNAAVMRAIYAEPAAPSPREQVSERHSRWKRLLPRMGHC